MTLDEFFKRDRGWLPFENTEPGYLRALFIAFQSILDSNTTLNINFIKSLHSLSTEKVKNLHYDDIGSIDKKGQLRESTYVRYALNLTDTGNTTHRGLVELLDKLEQQSFLAIELTYLNTGIFKENIDTFKEEHELKNNYDLSKFIFSALFKRKEVYLCSDIFADSPKAVSEAINKFLEMYLATYNDSINKAKTNNEKIKAIVVFIQNCEQLHPFLDGNCRTFCMLLLNHLLIRNNLPLAIMDNPNYFDAHSIDELIVAVTKGMQNTLELAQGKTIFNAPTEDIYKISNKSEKEYFDACVQLEVAFRAKLLAEEKLVSKMP